jgi:hypothetical protein
MDRSHFFALADIGGDGDDFTVVVVFLQPGNDAGGIQAAGISQYYFFDVFFIHCSNLLLIISKQLCVPLKGGKDPLAGRGFHTQCKSYTRW